MGMSIDEAIKHGEEQLEIFGGEHNEFIQTAIDTMRKYQRIEEIIKGDWDKGYQYYETVNRIRAVIEDGNDDF